MPTAFEQFDQFIGIDYQVDDWHDLYAAEANQIALQFAAADWRQLSEVWRNRSGNWLYRCVYSLRGVDGDQAAPILFDMILSPDARIARSAFYSLRAIDWTKVNARPEPTVFARLDQIAEIGAGPDREEIEKLIPKLR